MKKVRVILGIVLACLMMFVFDANSASAKEILKEREVTNIFGDVLGSIHIYDNGQIDIKYRYGLRQATVYYCEKGNNCDNNRWSYREIVESDLYSSYKNEGDDLETYSYSLGLESNKEYKVKVKAYVGNGTNYTGLESIGGSAALTSFQVETDGYINGSNTEGVKNKKIAGWLTKLQEIANTIVIPLIYVATGLLLVIKGALLGTQIVKSSDQPEVRSEKIHALKWLVIGVGITYAANTMVGLLTGFFKNKF